MSRPIKFMAWLKELKHMTEVYEIVFTRKGCSVRIKGYDHRHYRTFKQDEIDLYQFTGLLDKEGKEIFEGSVVKFCDWYIGDNRIEGGEAPIVFDNGCFFVDAETTIELCKEDIQNCDIRVIGHIAKEGSDE